MKRVTINLSEKQEKALKECMEKDLANNMSGYFIRLLADRHAVLYKRGPGRPKEVEDTEEEEVADIPNPDKMDEKFTPFLTKTEYEARRAMSPKTYPEL